MVEASPELAQLVLGCGLVARAAERLERDGRPFQLGCGALALARLRKRASGECARDSGIQDASGLLESRRRGERLRGRAGRIAACERGRR